MTSVAVSFVVWWNFCLTFKYSVSEPVSKQRIMYVVCVCCVVIVLWTACSVVNAEWYCSFVVCTGGCSRDAARDKSQAQGSNAP